MSKASKKREYYKEVAKRIRNENELGAIFLSNLVAALVNEKTFKSFFKDIAPWKTTGVHQISMSGIIGDVIDKGKYWAEILSILDKINRNYLEQTSYLELDVDDLIDEIRRELIPSLHGIGISTEMVIFYYYCRHQFNHPSLPRLLKEWEKEKKTAENLLKRIEREDEDLGEGFFDPPFSEVKEIDGKISIEAGEYLNELNKKFTDDESEEMAKIMRGRYNPKNKTITLKRGLVFYIFRKMVDINIATEHLNYGGYLLSKQAEEINLVISERDLLKKRLRFAKSENANLLKKVKNLVREKKKLESLSVSKDKKHKTTNLEKENAELKKKLVYALSRIEQLEEEVSTLEEEKEINKEISDNLDVIPKKTESTKKEMPEYGRVVVTGGNWNSKEKGEIEQFFDKADCEAIFVPAEETLRKQDLISSADLVIFDSSRHAHKYYAKIKSINSNILHINKSKAYCVKDLIYNPEEKKVTKI